MVFQVVVMVGVVVVVMVMMVVVVMVMMVVVVMVVVVMLMVVMVMMVVVVMVVVVMMVVVVTSFPAWPGEQSRVLSPNGRGGWTSLRPLRGLQEIRVATREESGVLGFPSRRGLTPRGWFPPLGKMRPLPATASQGKSPVPP